MKQLKQNVSNNNISYSNNTCFLFRTSKRKKQLKFNTMGRLMNGSSANNKNVSSLTRRWKREQERLEKKNQVKKTNNK